MILNVSGRTDIVAFYEKWFMNRYREGFIDVRNPFFPKNVSRIYFNNVDMIVFCTKNPIPIIKDLDEIKIPILFHVTLTPYFKDIEPNVPPKGKIIEAIKKVSEKVGINYIYVRYDPIFLNDKYTVDYHIKNFDRMCELLNGYVKNIIISFVDEYKNVKKNSRFLKVKKFTDSDYEKIGINFSKSAKKYNMTVQTCAEKRDLSEFGFIKRDCVNHEIAFKLTGKTNFKKWKERPCNCLEMADIGVYNSCKHFCKYCYANFDENKVNDNYLNHDDNSTMLIGHLENDDVIKERIK